MSHVCVSVCVRTYVRTYVHMWSISRHMVGNASSIFDFLPAISDFISTQHVMSDFLNFYPQCLTSRISAHCVWVWEFLPAISDLVSTQHVWLWEFLPSTSYFKNCFPQCLTLRISTHYVWLLEFLPAVSDWESFNLGLLCRSSCKRLCCSVLQRVAACCNVLQRVAACCSVLQCLHSQNSIECALSNKCRADFFDGKKF